MPKTLKQLRGFLGLTGYYRRFIKGYGVLAKPLTRLLQKDSYQWDEAANTAFLELKQAMVNPPVLALPNLALPNFSKPFVIEIYASNQGIWAVLMQKGHLIAFISKALSPRHTTLSTYEKELLAVIHAVQKWRYYLLDRHFGIKTDHLKHLLENKVNTSFQQRWLSKLLGYD